MSETHRQRRRRKFTAGFLEQLAGSLSTIGAAIFAAGALGPGLAAYLGSLTLTSGVVGLITADLVIAASFMVGGTVLKGWAKRLDDDHGRAEPI